MNSLATSIWQPSAQRVSATRLTAFQKYCETRWGRNLAKLNYAERHAWSIAYPDEFWCAVWEFAQVRGVMGSTVIADREKMLEAKWFPEAKLNYAENLLRRRDDADALVFWGEDKVRRRLTHAQLYRQVAQLAEALRVLGVVAGDRVAAYLPNIPEAVVAMLAASSIGAIFTSASPDFGVQGVLDRFGQAQPKVLFVADGYFYNGRTINSLPRIAEIAEKLPSLLRVIVVPYTVEQPASLSNGTLLEAFVAPYQASSEIDFALLPFNHPLFIMYSSGTTGRPKCIVHGAGGTLLQHIKEHQLHGDVRPNDRLFYFTTCGWMMWNWLASGLASGATLLLYDGSPLLNDGRLLFDYAEAESMTHFGTSAKFIDAIGKANLAPRETHQLTELRVVFSTGSPLVAEGYDTIYSKVKEDIQLASISGGTDIISCFVLGNPNAPVYRGEIQCAGLGMAVEVFDDMGQAIRGGKGELVCTRPFPSMPIGFWDDEDGSRYRATYFDRYTHLGIVVWCHGDFAERTEQNGFVIYGRSDATLNPGGVRIGTAEIYRQVDKLPAVVESLVIGQHWPPRTDGRHDGDVRVVLFVKLREGLALDASLVDSVKQTIRENTTLRHVPSKIIQVADIPRTKSGKIVELAVRNVVHGEPIKNIEALANPEALDYFRNLDELQA